MNDNLTTAIIAVASIIGIVVLNRKPKPKTISGIGEIVRIGGVDFAIISMTRRTDGSKVAELQDLASVQKAHRLGRSW